MKATHPKTDKGYDFSKKNKVSIWASKIPYAEIPDDYFAETLSKNGTRATNQWSKNYQIRFFNPEFMETNGAMAGLVDIEKAVGECSFSTSYIKPLLNKAKQKNLLKVSWVILLFENEYSAKTSTIESDEYTTLVGSFNYDEEAENLYEIEE